MEAYSDAVFEAADELRVGGRRWRCQVARSSFAVHGEEATKRELQSRSVTPRADSIGECHRLGTAFQPEAGECVGHEALAETGVDGSEHQISVGRPN